MRTIDIEGLKPLGNMDRGPWRVGSDQLLRTAVHGQPITTLETAQEVFCAYEAASAAGVGSPRPLEVVEVPGGYGVLVDYVEGIGLDLFFILGLSSARETGLEIGALARRLHTAHTTHGTDWNGRFSLWSRGVAPLLPDELGGRLVELVEEIPQTHTLLHGDLHLKNVIMLGGKPAIIDMESAGFGNPVLDLSIVRSRITCDAEARGALMGIDAQTSIQVSEEIWMGALEGYFEDMDAAELELMDARLRVLSSLERTWFECCSRGIAAEGRESLSEMQRAWLASFQGLLDEQLPRIDRLYP